MWNIALYIVAGIVAMILLGGYFVKTQIDAQVRGRERTDVHAQKLTSQEIQEKLEGKQVLIIGGTAGLGLAIAKAMAKKGAEVTVAGRRSPNVSQLKHISADLATVKNMHEFADAVPHPEQIDILLCTQGIITSPRREVTEDGIEKDLAISYLSRYVVVQRLIERGLKAKIFIMGYSGAEETGNLDDFNAEKKYEAWQQHMNTVVGNDALVIGLARRHPELAVYGLNPGLIVTEIRKNIYDGKAFFEGLVEGFLGLMSPTADQYADQILPVFVADLKKPGHEFMFNQKGNPIEKSKFLSVEANVEKVWSETEKLLIKVSEKE